MKALVTGAAGLIGSHLADALIDRGDDVILVDSLERTGAWDERPTHVPYLIAGVEDRFSMRNVLAGVDVVFHQAAIGGFLPLAARMTEANCLGTAVLMEEAARASVAKVVVASSQAVYGHGRWHCPQHGPVYVERREEDLVRRGYFEPRCPIDHKHFLEHVAQHESFRPAPASVYGHTKLFTERVALQMGEDLGVRTVALRYALTYGPRQSPTNPYAGIISIFSTRMVNGHSPIVFEDGLQLRDFTYVEDVVRANLLVAGNPRADGQALNVGTGRGTGVRRACEMLTEALFAKGADMPFPPTIVNEYRPTDARHVVTDPAALSRLGWEALVPLREGLRRFAEWYLSQPTPRDNWAEGSERLRRAGTIRSLA